MAATLALDGSFGEGGGQILRTALGLSLVTGTPFRIERIRAGRARPGLMRQHLTAVEAAAAIGSADVQEAHVGSQTLEFRPGPVVPGDHRFAVGTAGSATLVLQTVLPALLLAGRPSHLRLEGGTHNPQAPTFDFLTRVYLPLLARMGADVDATLERPGFYPAGGGRFSVSVGGATGHPPLRRLDLLERGEVRHVRATALIAVLPIQVAHRELDVVRHRLHLDPEACQAVEIRNSAGPGNALQIEMTSDHLTELVTGFGERGVRAELIAERTAAQAAAYLEADVPVGEHLADQLLLPLALAGAGSFRTMRPTRHTETQIETIRRFLGRSIAVEPIRPGAWHIEVT